jgi:hypothetical protein
VPPSFTKKFPAAKVKKTNWGAGFPDVYILDPGDELFTTIGKQFIEAQTKEYGTDHFYSADTFNENVPPTKDSVFLDGMSKKVFQSMAGADPKAVWVMQGWMFHYNADYWQPTQLKALLNAVPNEHMIILDLYSESHPVWKQFGVEGGTCPVKAGSTGFMPTTANPGSGTCCTTLAAISVYGDGCGMLRRIRQQQCMIHQPENYPALD